MSRCDDIQWENLCLPGVASNANDADGGAGGADKHIEVADVYTNRARALAMEESLAVPVSLQH